MQVVPISAFVHILGIVEKSENNKRDIQDKTDNESNKKKTENDMAGVDKKIWRWEKAMDMRLEALKKKEKKVKIAHLSTLSSYTFLKWWATIG